MLPKQETMPDPSAMRMPRRWLPLTGPSFMSHSMTTTGTMPSVEAAWL
jgi:hypothetical protein